MKKIIQGRVFDSDVSDLIGVADFRASSQGWWEAGLYVTPQSRRFFLAGEGGIMSRWRGKEGIVELSKEEACAWIEEYLGKVEDYLKENA